MPSKFLRVVCSWKHDPDSLLKCTSVFEDKDVEFDPDRVNLDSCVQLESDPSLVVAGDPGGGDSSRHCLLTLSTLNVPKKKILKQILVVSEFRGAEVYKAHTKEYVKTVKGERLEELGDDLDMYVLNIDLTNEMISECELKFYGQSSSAELNSFSAWLIDLQVSLSTMSTIPPPTTKMLNFDVSNIQEMVKESKLSDKALNFMSLFETFQRTSPPLNVGMEGASNTSTSSYEQNLTLLKVVADVEERLNNKIDAIAKEQNDKLDMILNHLQEMKRIQS